MPRLSEVREHEVAFCANVKSWADALFAQHPDWPFSQVRIEQFGVGNNKRQDIRVLDREHGTPILCGEVKMPGTPEGHTPHDPALMRDAYEKAGNIQCRYFFTWNVNTLVLFDRSKWDVRQISDQELRPWDLNLDLRTSGDCCRPEVEKAIREKFLPDFFGTFAAIVSGRLKNWTLPKDERFVKALHDYLRWPVLGTRDYLAEQSDSDPVFSAKLQEWMTGSMGWTWAPEDPRAWREVIDRAARTLCYIFSNRALFYEALRTRYEDVLAPLAMPKGKRKPHLIYRYFRDQFDAAVRASGDYEPVLYPKVNDWEGALVFGSPLAKEGWRGTLVFLRDYNFRDIASDTLGHIFKRLISPEERRQFGQFFTQDDIIDVINAFCIRRAGDVVLDPACGSGSFLVRAYHRKAWLSGQRTGGRRNQDHDKTHQQLLGEIFGCDIALFPAHLATLNLASRRIAEEENYPYVARRNFFEAAEERDAFCMVPRCGVAVANVRATEMRAVPLPDLDAVVGNPPYVRQEMIPRAPDRPAKDEDLGAFQARQKQTKEHLQDLCARLWPALKLSGRSDLHCYFWPVAAALLKEGGWFGFLTSSSWLDVEYGFPLQKWVLNNFRLVAVLESVEEPWFEDARIKTCVTILQRSSDPKKRADNVVKFVRLQRPLADILGPRDDGQEAAREEARQTAADRLRNLIEKTKTDYEDARLRIIRVPQARLWEEGVAAGALLKGSATAAEPPDEGVEADGAPDETGLGAIQGDYVAGKWGRYLRAPDLYFRLMREHGHRFVKLGQIAEVRRGITSGCDAFFMPRDVTQRVLADVAAQKMLWPEVGLKTACDVVEVKSGKVRIIQAGDRTLHPVEAAFLRPEVHSLMQVDRPVVRAADLDRVVLWVDKPLSELAGTYVAKYIRWGAKQTFQSAKSRAVPVPQRSTCAARPRWYDLTGHGAGACFWPMAQKYRHVVAANPEALLCNHNLFYVTPKGLGTDEATCLTAMLNSTVVALMKHFFGRYAGAEGTLKTEVVDTLLMEVPNPIAITSDLARRLQKALQSLAGRPVTHLVQEALLHCHRRDTMDELLVQPLPLPLELQQADRHELDDNVLQLIGVVDSDERQRLLHDLYGETVKYYAWQRAQDIQSMENRGGAKARRMRAEDLAEPIWNGLPDDQKGPPVLDWLARLAGPKMAISIPEGKATVLGPDHMLDPCGVDFRAGNHRVHMDYASPEQAALAGRLANLGVRGPVEAPAESAACRDALAALSARLSAAGERFREAAGARTGDDSLQKHTVELLVHWFVHGSPAKSG